MGPAAAAETADPETTLVELINEFRGSAHTCGARSMQPAGPLAPAPALARVDVTGGQRPLMEVLKGAGYVAARAQFVVLTGPPTAQAAMDLLRSEYCSVMLNAGLADIGVSREGATWQIVLARPLLSADLPEWREAGRAILERVNAARAQPRMCGKKPFGAAPPVRWEARLAQAARVHSRDMAARSYFAHAGKGGRQVTDRASAAGYDWRRVGENIAAGQGSVEQVVKAWLASPHHCENIMTPGFTEMGAAYAVNRASDATIYWTQVFAAP